MGLAILDRALMLHVIKEIFLKKPAYQAGATWSGSCFSPLVVLKSTQVDV